MSSAEHRPLAGLRLLDLTRNVAGPYASMILGSLGAEVIKVESEQGNDTRRWGPPFWNGISPSYLALNQGKRSMVVGLNTASAQTIIERLVDRSDVVLESFRFGVLERLGFGYEWASARNPALIYASVTSYGDQGPLRDRPGYDPLMQAFGGVMSVTGEAHRAPVRVGVSLIDMGTGMWTAMAVLSALLERGQTGRGSHVVTALYETALAWTGIPIRMAAQSTSRRFAVSRGPSSSWTWTTA